MIAKLRTWVAATAFAATTAATGGAQSVLVGVRAGETSARQQGDYHVPGLTYDRVRGRTAGLVGTVEIGPWLALQGEALYVEKGARMRTWYEIRLDYIEVPLSVRLSTPPLFGLRAFLVRGNSMSWETQCSGYTTPLTTQSRSVVPAGRIAIRCAEYRGVRGDRGVIAGWGLSFDRGRTQLALDVRRVRGSNIGSRHSVRNDVSAVTLALARRLR